MPIPVSCTSQRSNTLLLAPGAQAIRISTALLRELDGVITQVEQYLLQPQAIPDQLSGALRRLGDAQGQALSRRRLGQDIGHPLHLTAQLEGQVGYLDPPLLEPRELEDIVEDVEQELSAALGLGDIVGLGLVQAGAFQKLQQARDPAEGRADLVAHGGEKLALGEGGLFRCLPSGTEIGFKLLARRDIAQGDEGREPAIQLQGLHRDFRPEVGARETAMHPLELVIPLLPADRDDGQDGLRGRGAVWLQR